MADHGKPEVTLPAALAAIGQRLRRARQDAGKNQLEVCESLGLTVRSLTRWENGQNEPGIETITRLADLYGVSLDWLAGRTAIKPVVLGGMVLVDNAVVTALERIAKNGGSPAHLRPLLRNPGLDYVFPVPQDATVLAPEAARTLDTRMQAMVKKLGRNKR